MTRNCNIRFVHNNFNTTGVAVTYSSQSGTFPMANTMTNNRNTLGKFNGNFTITASNAKIYVGLPPTLTPLTVTLTPGNYTGTTLASHIQTAMNAAASGWVCTYSLTTYKFLLYGPTGSTLVLANNVNAVWDTIGYTSGVTFYSQIAFPGDAPRVHTDEWVRWDLYVPQEIGAAMLLGPIDKAMELSPTATVLIQGSNVDNWVSPPLSVQLEVSDNGAFGFLDGQTATPIFRYWRLSIRDRTNIIGPNISIGTLMIGPYITFDNSNLTNGFTTSYIASTKVMQSDSGTKYFDKRPKAFTLSGGMQAVLGNDRRAIDQFFYEVGIEKPFFMSIDPTLKIFDSHRRVTHLVRFDEQPTLTHIIRDIFDVSIAVSEVI